MHVRPRLSGIEGGSIFGHHLLTLTHIAAAFIAINFIAFAAFGLDKARAQRGQYRIAESTLLLFAFLGGTLGAYAGRKAFRHKTRGAAVQFPPVPDRSAADARAGRADRVVV